MFREASLTPLSSVAKAARYHLQLCCTRVAPKNQDATFIPRPVFDDLRSEHELAHFSSVHRILSEQKTISHNKWHGDVGVADSDRGRHIF
jgi:hypothetical protein